MEQAGGNVSNEQLFLLTILDAKMLRTIPPKYLGPHHEDLMTEKRE